MYVETIFTVHRSPADHCTQWQELQHISCLSLCRYLPIFYIVEKVYFIGAYRTPKTI